ncbi:MAG: DUF1349 domain-containing protein [Phycisphaerae bacterium]|jgi:regulation of enolase protein 1 (concanavalin A-like superfamily)
MNIFNTRRKFILCALLAAAACQTSLGQPDINVWYETTQNFGNIGKPQNYANILGNVSGPYSITSLTYSLNGEPNIPLTIGSDSRRLVSQGDFNIDIAWDDLQDANNVVIITAVDSNSDQTQQQVIIDFNSLNTWPLPYTADWNDASAIEQVAQVVDGNWAIQGDSVRTQTPGYDRLIAIGDITWTDYEVLVPVTIHAMNGGAAGVLFRWHGHTDVPISGTQPKSGYFPLGAITWYNSNRLEIYANGGGNLGTKSMSLSTGVTYLFRCRVETVDGAGDYYSIKVWQQGQLEPADWDIVGQAAPTDPADGCMLLITHMADVSFGTVSVVPIGIKNINVDVNDTEAVISWTTNLPADGNIAYGISSSYTDSEANSVPLTQHSVRLTDLTPNTLYHYQITSVDSNAVISNTTDRTFKTTGPDESGIVSDDFDAAGLDPNLWTFVNPVGDCNYALIGTGTQDAWLRIFVPGGVDHDPWTSGNRSARIMQDANNTDFEIEVKFESVMDQTYQIEGLFVQEDVNNFLRFDFHYNSGNIKNFAASFINLTPTERLNAVIPDTNPDANPIWMKVRREGNLWTQWYSHDGNDWTQSTSFTHAMNVTSVGPFAANAGGTSSPAFTCNIDYFFNTSSPVVPEDTPGEFPPVLEPIGDLVLSAGQVLDVNIYASDPCGQLLSFTAYDLPVFADFNDFGDGTALLHLEPKSADAGSYYVSVRVTDPCGLFDEETFKITVNDNNDFSGIVSDDFSSGQLDPNIWTFIDPLGDCNLAFTGTGTEDAWANISVPAGVEHQVWTSGIIAPHILQSVNDANFEIEVKFESPLTAQYQEQGIIIKQDQSNYIRFEFYSTSSLNKIYSATFSNGSYVQKINNTITAGAPLYMRIKRQGSNWTQTYSYDSQSWLAGASFNYPINVTAIGLYGGNAAGTSSPAHTASIDYFFNLAAPIWDEDPLDDSDADGYPDVIDNCPGLYNPDQNDVDTDGFGDVCDNCPFTHNTDQNDVDADGIGDECECAAANLDGINPIDFEDFSILALHWFESGPDGDTNKDGIVDFYDLAQVVQWWLESCD